MKILLTLTLVIISFLFFQKLILKNYFKGKLIILLDEVKITALKLKEGKFNIKLIITSTIDKTIKLVYIEYSLYGNDYEIGGKKIPCDLIIYPRKSIILNTHLEVKDSYGAGQIWASCKWRIPVYWKIKGIICFKSWLGPVKLSFASD
ncbi:MAG: hypothetical protein QXE05_03300 [Nitrososphaeria archaeon]